MLHDILGTSFLILLSLMIFIFIIYFFVVLFTLGKKPKSLSDSTIDYSLTVEDIDYLTPILNQHLQNLDNVYGTGFSLTDDGFCIMIKLKGQRSNLIDKKE